MRCHALVALLAASALFISADAARNILQNGDALSNSNGCLDTIPRCESGACATRNIMGVARWVCLRCKGTYEPVVTNDGQDNIIQCVCPRGFYETGDSCTRCPANQFCSGGDKVENPTTRGTNTTCGTNLITRNTGARSQADCVAPEGYARTSPTEGTACGVSEYAPRFNRLSKCLKCQSGLEEQTPSSLGDGQRVNKRTVCKIPPGKFMSQGLVRICPQGFFRQDWVEFDAPEGTLCLPCNPGTTTNGAGKGLPSDCNVVLPGYGVSEVSVPKDAAEPPSIPTIIPDPNDGRYPNATLCNLGFYSKSGQCVACPYKTVTTSRGAKSIEECVVPPGYYVPSDGPSKTDMVPCNDGWFRSEWVMWNSQAAETCTQCGFNIDGEAKDLDENPLVANGSLARTTPASCFIEPGYGMIAQGRNTFVGQECPINTYGVASRLYGWAAAPCKPCPRNMITDGLTKVTSMDTCVNDDGFGYASEGASRCAPGFYSKKASKKPCQQCPAGRTTANNATLQREASDCFVRPGFGVVNSTSNSTDPYNPNTVNPSDLPVLECPVGYFGAGGAIDSKCQKCPEGSSTEGTGSTSKGDCKVCAAGYGKTNTVGGQVSGNCSPCKYGAYQSGGGTQCSLCPKAKFYAPVDGKSDPYESDGTTAYTTSFGEEACFPIRSQLSPEAGQAYFAPGSGAESLLVDDNTATTLGACVESCAADKCCLAQFDTENSKCRKALLDPATSEATGKQVVYKLPPSSITAASSTDNLASKMLSSGYYAHCAIPNADAAKWAAAGSNLGADARTFVKDPATKDNVANRADCKKLCDNSNVCWGFVYDSDVKTCNFRGGVDALKTRSFFGVPNGANFDMAALQW